MQTEKPVRMNNKDMLQLKGIYLAPYMQLATALIGKSRYAGGNMFRHQIDTMATLIDYGYIDSVLLKASVIHDLVEDIPDFDRNLILGIDSESEQVYELVMEVTKKEGQSKSEYLRGIIEHGSEKAKILKCDETEFFIFPIALAVDYNMYQELISLVITRRRYLEECGYLNKNAAKK